MVAWIVAVMLFTLDNKGLIELQFIFSSTFLFFNIFCILFPIPRSEMLSQPPTLQTTVQDLSNLKQLFQRSHISLVGPPELHRFHARIIESCSLHTIRMSANSLMNSSLLAVTASTNSWNCVVPLHTFHMSCLLARLPSLILCRLQGFQSSMYCFCMRSSSLSLALLSTSSKKCILCPLCLDTAQVLHMEILQSQHQILNNSVELAFFSFLISNKQSKVCA